MEASGFPGVSKELGKMIFCLPKITLSSLSLSIMDRVFSHVCGSSDCVACNFRARRNTEILCHSINYGDYGETNIQIIKFLS